VAVGQLNDAVRTFRPDADGFLRREDFYSKALGLHHRTPRQIAAAKAIREPKIVLNARGRTRLAAWRFRLNNQGFQPLAGTVNRSR